MVLLHGETGAGPVPGTAQFAQMLGEFEGDERGGRYLELAEGTLGYAARPAPWRLVSTTSPRRRRCPVRPEGLLSFVFRVPTSDDRQGMATSQEGDPCQRAKRDYGHDPWPLSPPLSNGVDDGCQGQRD